MPAEPAALARNTSYFTLALVAQKIISFLYFTYLTRLFGPSEVGKYVFALSVTTVFSVLLDLGLANVMTREVARDARLAQRYVRLVFGFKLVATLLVVALVAAYVNLLGYPSLTRELVYMACVVMVLDSFILSAYSVIRGFHTLFWESIGTVLFQLVVATGGVVVSLLTRDLRAFMAALVLGVTVNFVYALWQLRWRFKVTLWPSFAWQGWRELAWLAWPFALAAILTRIYGYVDTLLLSQLSGDHAVGIYSVAYKVTFALQFIPAAFSASLFPGFSDYFISAKDKLAEIFVKGVIYLTAIAVPVALGIVAIAPEVVRQVYPAFSEAIVPLQILIFSLIFLFVTFPVGALLPACNRQPRQTVNLALAAVSNIALNLLLIPRYGPVGAAVASLASTVVLLAAGWVVVRQLVSFEPGLLRQRLTRITLAGLAMFVGVLLAKSIVGWVAAIPLGAAIYTVLVVFLGGVTGAELKDLGRVVWRRASVG